VDDNHQVDVDIIEKTKNAILKFNDIRISYVKNDVNIGVPHVFRKWISLVDTEYFFVAGDGDQLLPQFIAREFEIEKIKSTDFKEIDKFRIDNLTSYLVRNQNGVYSGYRTIYSPGENVLGLKILMNGRLVGYVTGVTSNEFIIFYEIILEKQQLIYDILAFLSRE